MAELFDLDQLDDNDPFEIDRQAAHLFKHAGLGIDDIQDVWQSEPLFYPAKTASRLVDGGRSPRRDPGGSARPIQLE